MYERTATLKGVNLHIDQKHPAKVSSEVVDSGQEGTTKGASLSNGVIAMSENGCIERSIIHPGI